MLQPEFQEPIEVDQFDVDCTPLRLTLCIAAKTARRNKNADFPIGAKFKF